MTQLSQHDLVFNDEINEVSIKREARHLVLIASHEPTADPRLGWIEQGSPEGISVHQIGIRHPSQPYGYLHGTPKNNMLRAITRMHWNPEILEKWRMERTDPSGSTAYAEIAEMNRMLQLPRKALAQLLGIDAANKRLSHFRWYLQYILDTTITLLSEAETLKGASGIIATDLDTLAAALLIKSMCHIPVFYDAHEYWPESDVDSLPAEVRYWEGLEARLVKHTDYCQTVSPGLADMMSRQYGVTFLAVPNCEPVRHALTSPIRKASDSCRFLFLGGFAPRRGIDILIDNWEQMPANAILLLQGRDNLYKEEMRRLAESTGLYEKRIFFPEAVEEDQLIATASAADVGFIPYTPTGNGYTHCSPNKMSQYMAAWLPIIANNTEFVAATVKEAKCGRVIDFTDTGALIETISALATDPVLRDTYGKNGYDYFVKDFNWNSVSQPFYEAISSMTEPSAAFHMQLRRSTQVRFGNGQSVTIDIAQAREQLAGNLIRKPMRFIYRCIISNSDGLLHRTMRPFYRLLPIRLRYLLIHRAG